MKKFIFYFIILALSVWLGIKIHQDPGYILITYQHWSVETTLWFGMLAIIFAFFLLYFLLRLFRGTLNLSGRWQNWTERRQLRKANKVTFRGLCELAEGDWKSAERNLLRGADHNDTPLVNYLAAAEAAQQQGNFEDRDNYLRSAHQSSSEAEVAVAFTQAQLQIQARQWELALATLKHLQPLAPHNTYILQLLQRVYLELKDWKNLQELLPTLRKQKVLKTEELDLLEQKIYFQLLQETIIVSDAENVQAVWESIPKYEQTNATLLVLYVDFLRRQGKENQAEELLRNALKKNWDSNLVNRYGLVKAENPEKQFAMAESWLKNHENDPELLLCLGRLAVRNAQLEKAHAYFSDSLKFAPRPETYRELGQVLEQLHDNQGALDNYRKGLSHL